MSSQHAIHQLSYPVCTPLHPSMPPSIFNYGMAMAFVMRKEVNGEKDCVWRDILDNFMARWQHHFSPPYSPWRNPTSTGLHLLMPLPFLSEEEQMYAFLAQGLVKYAPWSEFSSRRAHQECKVDALRFKCFIRVLEVVIENNASSMMVKDPLQELVKCVLHNIDLCDLHPSAHGLAELTEQDIKETFALATERDLMAKCSSLLERTTDLMCKILENARCFRQKKSLGESWKHAGGNFTRQCKIAYTWSRRVVEIVRDGRLKHKKFQVSMSVCKLSIEATRDVLLSGYGPDDRTALHLASFAHREDVSMNLAVAMMMVKNAAVPAAQMPATIQRDACRIHQMVPKIIGVTYCCLCIYVVERLMKSGEEVGVYEEVKHAASVRIAIVDAFCDALKNDSYPDDHLHWDMDTAYEKAPDIVWVATQNIVRSACGPDAHFLCNKILSQMEYLKNDKIYHDLKVLCLSKVVNEDSISYEIDEDQGKDELTKALSRLYSRVRDFRVMVSNNVAVYYTVYAFFLGKMKLGDIRNLCEAPIDAVNAFVA